MKKNLGKLLRNKLLFDESKVEKCYIQTLVTHFVVTQPEVDGCKNVKELRKLLHSKLNESIESAAMNFSQMHNLIKDLKE